MHLASIPTPGMPSHSEEAGNRHYNSMAHVQLGFAVHIRFHQADVLMPDLSGGSEVETIFQLSLLFLQARKIMRIQDCGNDQNVPIALLQGLGSAHCPTGL